MEPMADEPSPLDISADELKSLQLSDPSLDFIREAVRQKPDVTGRGFFAKEGLLFRRYLPPGSDDENGVVEQLILPTRCRRAVLQLAIAFPLQDTWDGTRQSTGLCNVSTGRVYKDTAEYAKACPECQKTAARRPPRAPLLPLPIIEEPFSRIAMDIVGPLSRSRSGKSYILVICDYATSYPEAVALKSIDAECIAEELMQLFSRTGIPQEILTDQGSNFMSQLLAELYRLLHIKPIRTTPYHPQTDGLIERFNQTLKAMLRRTATKEGKDWDKLIPYLLFAYREVPQASTGFSPFELLYGHQVRGPLDILRETWEASPKSSESVVSHVLSMHDKMAKLQELVHDNLTKAQQTQRSWYDQNARNREFSPGDRVLVLLPTATNKLLAVWQGLYPIIARLGRVVYEVDMGSRRRRKRFHINMLREWVVKTHSSQRT